MAADSRSRRPGLGHASRIRVRTTAAAAAVVGVALLIVSVAMIVYLQRSIRDDVRITAAARAELVAAALRTGSTLWAVDGGERDEEFVQVLDDEGDVASSSANVAGEPALARPPAGGEAVVERVPFEDGAFLAVSRPADTPDGPVTVVVGRSLEAVEEATAPVLVALAVGVPALLLLAGMVTWVVVGRALAPVERMRREVEAISAEELHRRVPDPPGSDEISDLASTMNRMLDRLQDAQARQRRFVSDAAHELRSPVASIRQHAEVAVAHPDRSDLRELAGVVLEEVGRLQAIVEDLLLLSRIDEGAGPRPVGEIDLDDLVFEEAARLRASTSVRIDTRAVTAVRVRGDRASLEHLLRNLTDNAVRHARSVVGLGLASTRGWAVLSVEDDGSGVDVGDRERVFDRFVRLDGARDRGSGGTGLGLAIVRQVARVHGGSVLVTDAATGGARFEVRLPSTEG